MPQPRKSAAQTEDKGAEENRQGVEESLEEGKQQNRPEEGIRDVSAEVEAVEKQAEEEPPTDDEGRLLGTTPEEETVISEMTYRSGAQANGGGPWPPDLLVQQFVGSKPLERRIPAYTSHEEAEE